MYLVLSSQDGTNEIAHFWLPLRLVCSQTAESLLAARTWQPNVLTCGLVVLVSPTGRSVLLIGCSLVALGLFRSLKALLNVEARATSSLVGELWIDELTEDVVRFRSGGLFRHEQVHQ